MAIHIVENPFAVVHIVHTIVSLHSFRRSHFVTLTKYINPSNKIHTHANATGYNLSEMLL